jgi:shikimate dehydrogenase
MLVKSGLDVRGKKIIVFGKGGSSLSVCHVMKKRGAGEIVTLASKDNCREFLSRHADSAILVNSTPVGMYPDTQKSPASLSCFPRLEGVLDLIYNPARTRLMMEAEELTLPCVGGLAMLVGQAAAAAEIFSGQKISEAREQEVELMLRRRMENIVLIGMPGCGKSTLGRLLAEKTGKNLVDIDTEIEKTAGRSIPDIFAAEGETAFRQFETAALEKFGKEGALVISTGGGCVTREENFFPLRQNGRLVFVQRDLALLARDGRPLSASNMEAMYEERLPLYRRFADCTVRNEGAPQIVAEKILEAIDEVTGN